MPILTGAVDGRLCRHLQHLCEPVDQRGDLLDSHCMQLNSHCMQLDGHCMQVLREVVAASAAPNGGTRLTLIDLGSSLTDEQLENSVQARSYMPKFSLSYPDF